MFVLVISRATEQFKEEIIPASDMASKLENLITAGLVNRAASECETLFRHMTIYNGIHLYNILDTLPLPHETTYAFLNVVSAFLYYNIAESRNEPGCLH